MVREESAKKKGRALIQGSEEGHFHHEAFLAHFQGRAGLGAGRWGSTTSRSGQVPVVPSHQDAKGPPSAKAC